MGRNFFVDLQEKSCYCCKRCKTQLALKKDILSEAFRGRTGTAWLFNRTVNIYLGRVEDRMMTTGPHTIADIFCKNCNMNLGWKYERAYDPSQKYKQGRYILEMDLIERYGQHSNVTSCDESIISDEDMDAENMEDEDTFNYIPHTNSDSEDIDTTEVVTISSGTKTNLKKKGLRSPFELSTSSLYQKQEKIRLYPINVDDPIPSTTRQLKSTSDDEMIYAMSHFFPTASD